MSQSCASKIHSNKRLYLVNGIEENGGKAWYYIEVDAIKEAIFKRRCTLGSSFDMHYFGNIVASGWGDSPPNDVRKEFEEK